MQPIRECQTALDLVSGSESVSLKAKLVEQADIISLALAEGGYSLVLSFSLSMARARFGQDDSAVSTFVDHFYEKFFSNALDIKLMHTLLSYDSKYIGEALNYLHHCHEAESFRNFLGLVLHSVTIAIERGHMSDDDGAQAIGVIASKAKLAVREQLLLEL